MKKLLLTIFLNCFSATIMDFLINLTYFVSNIIPGGVPTCQIFSFQDQHFQKYKAQKIVEFSFLAFLAHFFKHFALKTYRCPKQFLCYYDFICRRACKKRSKFNVFGWFPGHQNLHVFFLKIYCRESFEIIFRQKYFPKVSFLDFVLVIHLVLKNQES